MRLDGALRVTGRRAKIYRLLLVSSEFHNAKEREMGSVVKKRRKKIRKHKHKKLMAKMRHKKKKR